MSETEQEQQEPRTFTQQDVDRYVRERLLRAKTEPPPDYEDLKEKAKRLEELEAAQQSDAERLAKELEKLTRERDDAVTESKRAAEAVREERVRSAVIAAASTMKAADPADVYALLPKSAVTIDDDGQVVGVQEAVSSLLELKPHLVGSPVRPKPDASQGPRGDSNPAPGMAGAAEAERRFGTSAAAL